MPLHVGIYWMAHERWRLQVSRPNRRTETKTVYGPRETAEAAAAEWRAELETHGLSDIPGSTPLANIIRMRLPLLKSRAGDAGVLRAADPALYRSAAAENRRRTRRVVADLARRRRRRELFIQHRPPAGE